MSGAGAARTPRSGARAARSSGGTSSIAPAARGALAQRLDDERPHRDRRHEVPVHHVDVDHARAGVEHLLHLPPRAGRSRPPGSTARRAGRRAPVTSPSACCRRRRCRSRSRCSPCARSSSARRSPGRPRPARSGAGSRRSGSGPAGSSGAATARRSCGQRVPELGAVAHRSVPLAAQRRDEEAVAALHVREREQLALAAAGAPTPGSAPAGRPPRSRDGHRGRLRSDARSRPLRPCTSNRRSSPPARTRQPQRTIAAPARRRGYRRPPAWPASAGRGATGRVPRPEHGASSRTRAKRSPRRRGRAASPTSTVTLPAPHPLRRCAAARAPAPAWRSTATISPRALHQRREVRRLAARRRAQVEHALAGLRGRARGRRASTRATAASARRRATAASRGRRRARARRPPRAGRRARAVATGSDAAERGGVGAQRVRAQRALGRLVGARSSARARSGPSCSHQRSTIHGGIEWRIAAAAGSSSRSAAEQRLALARERGAGTALTSAWPCAGLASSTASLTTACVGARGEAQLVGSRGAAPRAAARRSPRPGARQTASIRWSSVSAALHGAVGEAHRRARGRAARGRARRRGRRGRCRRPARRCAAASA